MSPRRIAFLGFDGLTALDLVGPADAFASAFVEGEDGRPRPCYEIAVIGLKKGPFVAQSGVVFKPTATLETAGAIDTLIVPGGPGLRRGSTARRVSAWIAGRAGQIRRIASVCTGIYGIAPTGLLDGRRVTTHWNHAADVAVKFPKLKLEANALFLKDGPFYTSAGITAGIDLSLALIEEDFGPTVALSVARELVVYMKRSGGQEQYSEPLKFQVQSAGRFADIAAWIPGHLRADLSVEALAEKAFVCPRHFSRQFKAAFGSTPAAFVEAMRLDEARRRLVSANRSIEATAASVGFRSADSFRRAFERRFGIPPSIYRSRFETGRLPGGTR
ncbi:MAG TPA: helix-turn-helix domain-containing protein [Thermoanaerobaculia bacterium]|nr:helix-turn-helix domain-containing protein [Thermoanaerobaculia bacterium]